MSFLELAEELRHRLIEPAPFWVSLVQYFQDDLNEAWIAENLSEQDALRITEESDRMSGYPWVSIVSYDPFLTQSHKGLLRNPQRMICETDCQEAEILGRECVIEKLELLIRFAKLKQASADTKTDNKKRQPYKTKPCKESARCGEFVREQLKIDDTQHRETLVNEWCKANSHNLSESTLERKLRDNPHLWE